MNTQQKQALIEAIAATTQPDRYVDGWFEQKDVGDGELLHCCVVLDAALRLTDLPAGELLNSLCDEDAVIRRAIANQKLSLLLGITPSQVQSLADAYDNAANLHYHFDLDDLGWELIHPEHLQRSLRAIVESIPVTEQ